MGRRKGDTDKGKRKSRGGTKTVLPNTQPIFCSSFNNQRGNRTATQRRFAAHFVHEATGEPSSNGVSTVLDVDEFDGLSANVNDSEEVSVVPPVGYSAAEGTENIDDNPDSDDESYDPEADDDSEEDDDRSSVPR